ncbi:MAG: ABC transporter ATP-binding protein/permease [Firmicutes bacterium]|nr:ABC transporter ATP-binding protein/permease [Bacillota bacterium]
MIQLKNVSKFYHSKGVISSGIMKINLTLDKGEFVVITGESGSGKTTLLNVISGLDSYEEGEMYVNGKETSHFMASDFEKYRNKYIGNIFQNYNLINSYTVYQNVELSMRINGCRRSEMKQRVNEILEKVGLAEFAGTKASKLSGGQKQRVAIARALAKDTDIIVADEPTGNLDSESAKDVAKLLSDISADKLVIVVTHNYEQFADYATRRVKLHDGSIIENAVVNMEPQEKAAEVAKVAEPAKPAKKKKGPKGRPSVFSIIRLGLRNTFNIGYKFVLLLVVFLFMVVAVTSQYTSYLNQKAESDAVGYNSYFYNYSADRIVLKKKDGSAFTEDDYQAISNISNVKSIAKNDMVLDQTVYLENDSFSYQSFMHTMDEFTGDLAKGRMPEKNNEIILMGNRDDYMFSDASLENVLDKGFTIYVGSDTKLELKVVGIAYNENAEKYESAGDIFMTDAKMKDVLLATYSSISTVSTTINKQLQEYVPGSSYYRIMPNELVKDGKAMVYEEVNSYYDDGNATGKKIQVEVDNLYYNQKLTLKISDIYKEKGFLYKTGYKSFEDYGGAIFISHGDYRKLFGKGNFQCSVYVKDTETEDQTIEALKRTGYTTLALRDALVTTDNDLMSFLQVPMIIIILLAVFFIGYLVIRLIFRSRTSYFGIIRMLGMSKRNIMGVLWIELFVVMNIAFAIFMGAVTLVQKHIINVEYLNTLIRYMEGYNYVVLYIVIALMSTLIAVRFSRRLFKKTAMGSFREEA